jgi:hypothetical protein
MSMDVYILHSAQLPQREEVVKQSIAKLQQHGLASTITIIQSNDPSDIHVNLIQQIIDYSVINDAHLTQFNQFTKNIHINQLSHTLKHYDTLQRIAKDGDDDKVYMVIEDDALLQEASLPDIKNVHSMMVSQKAPIVFLGLPSTTNPAPSETTIHETAAGTLVPLIDAYLITRATAKVMVDGFLPIRFTGTVQLNYVMHKALLRPWQASKPIIINGSRYGLFPSSLNPNNTLAFNPDYMEVMEILKKGSAINPKAEARVEELREKSLIAKSPDFLYLIAKFYTIHGKYKEAEKIYTESYNIALSNGCIVNHESLMLKDFIRLFKHLQ